MTDLKGRRQSTLAERSANLRRQSQLQELAAHDLKRKQQAQSRRHNPLHHPYRGAAIPGQYIHMIGTLTNGTNFQQHSFIALAGPTEPTISGGFAKWGVVDRPRRVGMTVLQGYDPFTLVVQLQFERIVHTGRNPGSHVEDDLENLEWMGGRGRRFRKDGSGLVPGAGDSPLVSCYAINHLGEQIALIPPTVQNIPWVVSDITYSAGALRNSHGDRLRQVCDVTLTQYISAPGSSDDSPSTRAKQRNADAGKYTFFRITKATNTYMAIAARFAHSARASTAQEIMRANKNNGRLSHVRSIHADLTKYVPVGTKVRVPQSLAKHE